MTSPSSIKQTFNKLSVANNACWKYGIFPTFLTLFIVSTVLIIHLFFNNPFGSEAIQELPQISPSDATKYHSDHIFPHIVHQMWKTKDSLTSDFKRWKKGCERLNSNYSFHLYDDSDLKLFTHQHYPEYSDLFDALHGVYMADMARMLIAYHFGGLYIDLDFYCYRTFECLENYVLHQLIEHLTPAANATQAERNAMKKELLDDSSAFMVVSREPDLHARYIHQQSRIVIQDFFLLTPKHPFLKWFIDRENKIYLQNKEKNLEMKKGPFSYSIQTTLDDYYREQGHRLYEERGSLVATRTLPATTKDSGFSEKTRRQHWRRRRALTNSTDVSSSSNRDNRESSKITSTSSAARTRTPREFILEMKAEIVHPLVDSTNSRIPQNCQKKEQNEQYGLTATCNAFSKGKYLYPTINTMLVHMWTHSFLSFSFLRGWYEHSNYLHVEKTLQPTYQCPIPTIH